MNWMLFIDSDTLVNMIGLSFVGTLAYAIRQLPGKLWMFLVGQFTVELIVPNEDPAYNTIVRWLASSGHTTESRALRLTSRSLDDGDRMEWAVHPGPGTYLIPRGLRSIHVEIWRDESMNYSRLPNKEKITFKMLGRDPTFLRELIQQIYNDTQEVGVVSVYSWQGWWRRVMRKRMRSLDTIVLRPGVVDKILNDLEWFCQSTEWYADRGIPYRRAYLFCGPPGTGKTSLIQALAGKLGRPVALLNLGSITNDASLMEAVLSAPANAIIVMEDVDCAKASESRELVHAANEEDKKEAGITLSGLLNCLDGVATPDGRIFMLTTNHPEKLDSALLRPGRADVRQELGMIGPEEVIELARRFYSYTVDVPCGLPERVSPAAVQQAFMLFPSDPDKAFDHIKPKTEGPWR